MPGRYASWHPASPFVASMAPLLVITVLGLRDSQRLVIAMKWRFYYEKMRCMHKKWKWWTKSAVIIVCTPNYWKWATFYMIKRTSQRISVVQSHDMSQHHTTIYWAHARIEWQIFQDFDFDEINNIHLQNKKWRMEIKKMLYAMHD